MALKKSIGLWSATTIVIGSIIGSNIFMIPATMAGHLGSPLLLLAVWVSSGFISLFGAMAFAELGTMFPETGGAYIYLEKMYGEFIAFLYGWSSMAVINTAAIAAMAYVFASYLGFFIHLPRLDPAAELSFKLHIPYIADIYPLQQLGTKILAVLLIFILAVINYISVKSGNAIQFVATLLKTLALVLLVFGILFSGAGSFQNLLHDSKDFHLSGFALFTAFMAATTGALAAYDGWVNINMIAGEMKNPQKNLTRSLIVGVFICIAVYTLVNLALLYVLPIDEMAASPLVASDAVEKVFAREGGAIIALLILVSAFGATNINLLTNARVVFAMGRDKTFFSWTGKIHPRFLTPGNAVLLMAIISSLFVISGSFDVLAEMFVFMSWVFYALCVVGLFIMRRKLPHHPRPYKVTGYPWIPGIFVLFTLFYLGSTLYHDISNYNSGKSPIINSVVGLLLTLAGIPLFWYFKRRTKN